MSLAHGRPYLAIPGPSVVPDRVLREMHRPSPNIYAGELIDMMPGIVRDLKAVARTAHDVAVYIGNGHAAWEAALANAVAPGDRVLLLATGRFATSWGLLAKRMGIDVETIDFGLRSPIDPARVSEVLEADREHRIKAVLAVQSDTATSILSDIAAVRSAMDAAAHPALLMVDCIACLACDRMEMDAWGVDLIVAASQKGLMTPPGLGFVYFNERARQVQASLERVSPYWDWRPRTRPEGFYEYFSGTAPTHHLYGLRASLDMLLDEGIEAVWTRHDRLARAVWAAFEAWSARGSIELNVADERCRSRAVTSIRIAPPYGTRLREWLETRAGVTLGIGLGMAEPTDLAWHGFFRVAHMGHVNAHMVMGVLGTIQAGLDALGVERGDGGLDAAAAVISEA
ncbi:pyridoxal-phosphate-dependent aminotransferase family protein [Roseitranquillus sediminis]|uniref:pyridoxal-phosphate-dependent aminotransferase family protein n=1 Tax=Roseitranquillus sediminis TaxID=2809051 RepID=UPI001D0CC236|nr:aminotransferase class V-fold PLP-dependent enzyme [Roseitranquillus sediminis]MBM9595810.1 alanine--glyoxylate aminotransferase family protein [Roseitranquillus sediminis]